MFPKPLLERIVLEDEDTALISRLNYTHFSTGTSPLAPQVPYGGDRAHVIRSTFVFILLGEHTGTDSAVVVINAVAGHDSLCRFIMPKAGLINRSCLCLPVIWLRLIDLGVPCP